MRWAGGGDGEGEMATGLAVGLESGERGGGVAPAACGPPHATSAMTARKRNRKLVRTGAWIS
jgi:hypothetical protein